MLCDSGRSSIHVSGFLGVTSSPLVHQVLLGVLAPAGFAFEFGEIDDEELLHDYLEHKRGKKLEIVHPQKGEHLKIVNLCIKNANEHLAQQQGRLGKEIAALEELGELLGLPKPPEYIESYDISHTFGADNVAGMVVFHNGRPMKKAYKRFSIKGFDGQNDVGSMNEVLERRFNHYYNDDEESTFTILPDLILLDGGKGHVNAVAPLMRELGLDIPLFGMVKDNKHRTRAIATGGGEIQINGLRSAFSLVTQIQDEVHRYSVKFMHSKHKKKTYSSELLTVKGIGEKKAAKLMLKYKTRANLLQASPQELAVTAGVSLEIAQELWRVLHN